MTNTHAAFAGSIPENYDKYLGPALFDVYAKEISKAVAHLKSGAVLEVAAGSGISTRRLRDALNKSIKLVATDLNEDMLKVLRKRFDASENMEFKVVDALSLPFEDKSFEGVVFQFGLMFYPDKLAALREVRRVLKPKGLCVFNVWDSPQHNLFGATVKAELSKLYPKNPPNFFDTPFGCYQIDPIKNFLHQAGFGEIEIAVQPRLCHFPSARDAVRGFVTGSPVILQITERGTLTQEQVMSALEQEIARLYGNSPAEAKMQAIQFIAQ